MQAEPDGHRTEPFFREEQEQRRARTEAGRGRSRFREAYPQPEARKVGEEADVNRRVHQQNQWQRDSLAFDNTGTGKQSFVSFYFTNVPENISYIALRRGFEVCGIMEDVYLAKKRNVNGGVFGFVRYAKVLNVDKLLKALNNVWFGDWRVVAKVASFDMFGNKKNDEGAKVEGDNFKVGSGINVVRDHFKG